MRETLVTIEPTSVHAELVDGRLIMAIATNDARMHIQGAERPTFEAAEPLVTIALAGARGNLDMTAKLVRADVDALVEAFTTIAGGKADD